MTGRARVVDIGLVWSELDQGERAGIMLACELSPRLSKLNASEFTDEQFELIRSKLVRLHAIFHRCEI